MKRLAAALLALAVAACSAGPVHSPRLLSSRGPGLGPQRLVVEFVDRGSNAPLDPGEVTATLRDRHGSPLAESDGTKVPTAAERVAFVFHFDLPEPDTYQLTFVADGASFAGPVGDKLYMKDQEEVLLKTIIIAGVMSIQSGDNPRVVESKLLTFLPPARRAEILAEAA